MASSPDGAAPDSSQPEEAAEIDSAAAGDEPQPSDFFAPWEPDPVDSLKSFLDLAEKTFSRWAKQRVQYAWRGVVDAGWPLHSALYRRMVWTHSARTEEKNLAEIEGQVLADAHRWGFHYLDRAHLPIMYQLAMLQHFGAPTRLLDVTFSPLVALYFAVEKQLDDFGEPTSDERDGRLFIFDVSSRLINEMPAAERRWEESYSRPWVGNCSVDSEWRKSYWAWRPAPIEARFAAQNGGFIFGGVPVTGGGGWRQGPDQTSAWPIATVRSCTSVAVRFHRLEKGAGRPPDNPTFTVRVAAEAKEKIRRELLAWFDIEARTVYPDHPGFSNLGVPQLQRRPGP